MIREGAETLHKMSAAEKWRVSNDVLYRQYSTEFNHEAERLLEKANARNLDGATLAWVECTMSCVRCHKHARVHQDRWVTELATPARPSLDEQHRAFAENGDLIAQSAEARRGGRWIDLV